MTFQASDFKGKYFLELLDNNNFPIKSVYTKNSMWLKSIGHSNSLCVRATRAITNHAPTGEYHLRFFILVVLAVIIQLNQDVISFMSVGGIITIGIPIGSLLTTSSCS